LFEQRWAWAVLDRVLEKLREQYRANGQEAVFEALKGRLTGGAARAEDVGTALGMTAGAVDVAGHRLRRRYRALLREEIAETVEGPEQAEEEIRYLRSCL
jgi:RNA polymerase sigma-70 factor (ECF subfamily)